MAKEFGINTSYQRGLLLKTILQSTDSCFGISHGVAKLINTEKKLRSGIIPFYVKDKEFYFLLMKPSDPRYGSFEYQICKGVIDPGETELDAAIREGKEELGLKEANMENIYKIGKFNSMTVYACSIHSKDDFDQPHYETKETKWLTEKEFTEIGRKWQKFIINITSLRLQKLLKLNFKEK